jgi:ribulose-5-phosphate 4-epimerase/fuculose-1-phosphate aldolase
VYVRIHLLGSTNKPPGVLETEENPLPEDAVLEQLVGVSRKTGSLGFVVAGEGNTSARTEEGSEFWLKRSGCSLGSVEREDFVKLEIPSVARDLSVAPRSITHRTDPRHRPSIEAPMHAAIYASQQEARFVIHTHPPNALAGACQENPREFFTAQFPDSVVYLGVLDRNWVFVEYAPPGPTIAGLLRDALEGLAGDLRVVVLQNHGILTVGTTAEEALARTQMVEKTSYVQIMSSVAGRPRNLHSKDVAYLEEMEAEKYRQRVLKGEL